MADQLMPSILVHQALHGYNDGHRLISSSLSLDASDTRLMLVMSDLSGPGMKPPASGYLTGYPLEGSGKYVLARTWAAPEMPRPGCVWTHSLIIENADLARLMSAQALLDSFMPPTNMDTRSTYGGPVSVSPQLEPNGVPTERAEFLLQALYSFPTHQIVIEAADPFADEEVVTAIWMQQWPRLRRSFGFCTLSGIDRSGKGVVLDLQFVPERDRQLRSKFPSAVVALETGISDGLQPLLTDLEAPSASTLREFLKRTGGDVDGGRRAMLPLCELHKSLLESYPPDLVTAVSSLVALDNGGKKQARSIRALVARHAMKAIDRLEDVVFEFLLETLEQLSDDLEQVEMGAKICVELWRRSPHRFHSALVSEGLLADVAIRALVEMKPEQIVSGLESNTDIVIDIVGRRPDIMLLTAFWRIPEVDDGLVECISPQDMGFAARALLAAGRSGPATTAINKADPTGLIQALESNEADPKAVQRWLVALCRDQNKLAAVFATGQVKRMTTVVTVARIVSPDDIPNNYGVDPWLIALRSASSPIDEPDKDFLAAFLLNRALGWRSRSQAELLQYSYTQVYKAFQNQNYSRDTERLACSRLGWRSWFDWDNCSRLRETVAKRFIENDLEPEVFGRLTYEAALAQSLIDEAAHTKKGRAYLKRVHETLRYTDERDIRARADYIAESLK